MSKRVAIAGASRDRRKYGNKAVRAYREAGWTVYPVNPSADEVEGERAYGSLKALPEPVDRVSLYLHAEEATGVLREMPDGLADVELFLNPGADDPAVVRLAYDLGLKPRLACSIVDIGLSPEDFPDR